MSFNLGNVFACHALLSKTFLKKEKIKIGELKCIPKILIPFSKA
jgi:hypothetical protein